jgi:hypothetical protein
MRLFLLLLLHLSTMIRRLAGIYPVITAKKNYSFLNLTCFECGLMTEARFTWGCDFDASIFCPRCGSLLEMRITHGREEDI